MRPNIVAAASGAQNYADQTMRNDMFNKTFSGLEKGYKDHKKLLQSQLLTKALAGMAGEDGALKGFSTMTPEQQAAAKQRSDGLALVAMLGNGLEGTDIASIYKAVMPQTEDPLKMKNELDKAIKVANIRANAIIEASKNGPTKVTQVFSYDGAAPAPKPSSSVINSDESVINPNGGFSPQSSGDASLNYLLKNQALVR